MRVPHGAHLRHGGGAQQGGGGEGHPQAQGGGEGDGHDPVDDALGDQDAVPAPNARLHGPHNGLGPTQKRTEAVTKP